MINKFANVSYAAFSVLAISLVGMGSAFASGGCVTSPENPTLVLAALGSAAGALPWLRAKLGSRRNSNRNISGSFNA